MSELTPLLETLVADVSSGQKVALCTVVKTKGSTPRRPGAAMLVRDDGTTLGTLGGGLVEAQVSQTALAMLRATDGSDGTRVPHSSRGDAWGTDSSGESDDSDAPSPPELRPPPFASQRTGHPQATDGSDGTRAPHSSCGDGRGTDSPGESALLEYGLDQKTAADEGGICGGRMQIAVTLTGPGTDLQPYEDALASLRRGESTHIRLLVEHEGRRREYRLHFEVPPVLLVVGGGHVGLAVAQLAADLDFRIVVIDDRAEFASSQRFGDRAELIVGDVVGALTEYPLGPSCYVVIATRGHRHDLQALEAVIGRPTAYVGMIGSKRKIRMVFDELKKAGVAQEQLDSVHTPIGVAIGAETVPEIAVSIAAELIRARRKTVPKLIEGPIQSQDA